MPASPFRTDDWNGITTKQWIKIPDYSDADYIKATEDHQADLGIAIVMKGIAVEFKDEEGKSIEDSDEKLTLMKNMGLSHSHCCLWTRYTISKTIINDPSGDF